MTDFYRTLMNHIDWFKTSQGVKLCRKLRPRKTILNQCGDPWSGFITTLKQFNIINDVIIMNWSVLLVFGGRLGAIWFCYKSKYKFMYLQYGLTIFYRLCTFDMSTIKVNMSTDYKLPTT